MLTIMAPKIRKISLYYSLLSGISAREGFARDCVLRQAVSTDVLTPDAPWRSLQYVITRLSSCHFPRALAPSTRSFPQVLVGPPTAIH